MLAGAGVAPPRPALKTAPVPLLPACRPFSAVSARHCAPRPLGAASRTAPASQRLDLLEQLHTCGMTPLGGGIGPGPPSESEFHVNFGRAVRTLREDIPRFFMQAPTTSVLAEEGFVFVDRIGRVHLGGDTTVVYGVDAYRRHLFMLRLYCNLVFSRCSVEVLRMWPRDTHTVAVRWTLRCAPRLAPGRPHKVLALDGVSEYKFNSRGFIREHSADIINWDDGKRAQSKALVAIPGAAMPAAFQSVRDVELDAWSMNP